jgi:ATPase subunit of ABC transporter with duplicated ATPase domains
MDCEKTVLSIIEDAGQSKSYEELRALLGKFMFKGTDVEKKV